MKVGGISALLVVPMIFFFNLSEIATIAAIAVLLIQGFTHVGHLFKRSETGGNLWLIIGAVLGSFGAALFAISYTSRLMPQIVYYILGFFVLAFTFEVLLRLFTGRVINRQIILEFEEIEQKALKRLSL